MSASSIRDPLDRLVTRREAHLIAGKCGIDAVTAMIEQGIFVELVREAMKAIATEDADMAARVRAGG